MCINVGVLSEVHCNYSTYLRVCSKPKSTLTGDAHFRSLKSFKMLFSAHKERKEKRDVIIKHNFLRILDGAFFDVMHFCIGEVYSQISFI